MFKVRSFGNCLPQKQSGLAQIVFIGRVLQELQAFGVGRNFVLVIAREIQHEEQNLVGNLQAVIEGVLNIELVAQVDVGEFMREDHGQAGFVGQNVNQPRLRTMV